jgi:hypothetical protein
LLQSTLEFGSPDRVALIFSTGNTMKVAGFLLMCAGFAIVLCTFLLLSTSAPRGAFVLAGIAVQVMGLVLVFRAHITLDEEH